MAGGVDGLEQVAHAAFSDGAFDDLVDRVVKAIGKATLGDALVLVHRMANPGKIDLELIEVQTGSYLGEDDIIRIEDVYNRQ